MKIKISRRNKIRRSIISLVRITERGGKPGEKWPQKQREKFSDMRHTDQVLPVTKVSMLPAGSGLHDKLQGHSIQLLTQMQLMMNTREMG